MLVLGIAMIVTVLGMGTLTVSRISGKSTAEANDWEAAGELAFSATEHAISSLNAAAAASPTNWRAAYVSRQTAFTQAMGRGSFSWAIKDETDGNLAEDYLRAFRIYGIGQVGSVTRVYSVQVIPAGGPLDVLRTALHSSSTLTLNGSVQAINGPYSSNSSVKVTGPTVTGNIEAASSTGNLASGTVTAPSPAKIMPSTTVFADLLANATVIPFSALGGPQKMQNCLLSASSNPYGPLNSNGIYSITIPATKTLAISNCRIVGTLLLSFGTGGTLQIQGPVEWEPSSLSYPILVVSGTGTNVNITGCNTWLTESSAGVNLNPASTPFQGSSDTNTTDDFPPEYNGVMHFMCGTTGSINIGGNAYFNGTVIADCPVQASPQTTFVQSPATYANPPFGYASGNVLSEVPGSWRWDTLP